jgi:hypothetical protein
MFNLKIFTAIKSSFIHSIRLGVLTSYIINCIKHRLILKLFYMKFQIARRGTRAQNSVRWKILSQARIRNLMTTITLETQDFAKGTVLFFYECYRSLTNGLYDGCFLRAYETKARDIFRTTFIIPCSSANLQSSILKFRHINSFCAKRYVDAIVHRFSIRTWNRICLFIWRD